LTPAVHRGSTRIADIEKLLPVALRTRGVDQPNEAVQVGSNNKFGNVAVHIVVAYIVCMHLLYERPWVAGSASIHRKDPVVGKPLGALLQSRDLVIFEQGCNLKWNLGGQHCDGFTHILGKSFAAEFPNDGTQFEI
jgi:hypothetical protein